MERGGQEPVREGERRDAAHRIVGGVDDRQPVEHRRDDHFAGFQTYYRRCDGKSPVVEFERLQRTLSRPKIMDRAAETAQPHAPVAPFAHGEKVARNSDSPNGTYRRSIQLAKHQRSGIAQPQAAVPVEQTLGMFGRGGETCDGEPFDTAGPPAVTEDAVVVGGDDQRTVRCPGYRDDRLVAEEIRQNRIVVEPAFVVVIDPEAAVGSSYPRIVLPVGMNRRKNRIVGHLERETGIVLPNEFAGAVVEKQQLAVVEDEYDRPGVSCECRRDMMAAQVAVGREYPGVVAGIAFGLRVEYFDPAVVAEQPQMPVGVHVRSRDAGFDVVPDYSAVLDASQCGGIRQPDASLPVDAAVAAERLAGEGDEKSEPSGSFVERRKVVARIEDNRSIGLFENLVDVGAALDPAPMERPVLAEVAHARIGAYPQPPAAVVVQTADVVVGERQRIGRAVVAVEVVAVVAVQAALRAYPQIAVRILLEAGHAVVRERLRNLHVVGRQ